MSTKAYLVRGADYRLGGAGFYIGISRLLSPKIKGAYGPTSSAIVMTLALAGMFLVTGA